MGTIKEALEQCELTIINIYGKRDLHYDANLLNRSNIITRNVYLKFIIFVLPFPVIGSVKLECVNLIIAVERGNLTWHILAHKLWTFRSNLFDTHNLDVCRSIKSPNTNMYTWFMTCA